ncbi:threonine synthase [Chloroflexota bacterium]
MTVMNSFVCRTCGTHYPLDTREWLCSCGGFFELLFRPEFDPAHIEPLAPGLWRYRALLPLHPDWEPVALGEGNTPLLELDWRGRRIRAKLESLAPTGSFKDRGAAVLVTALRGLGVRRVVEDSSGNAGASLAAYAGKAGIACEVCVPSTAAAPKLAQIATYGAEVIEIRGRREYAALAAWAAAAHGVYYASRLYNPFFQVGVETLAFELWEQLGRRAPGALLLPVGSGTLLLGTYSGFVRLHEAGLVDRVPRIYGVQAAACAPIYKAFVDGDDSAAEVEPEPTVATGIAVRRPVLGTQILMAVRQTDGAILSVTEDQIEATRNQMAREGLHVEETSAAAVAALPEIEDPRQGDEPFVVVLTGHGLKTHRCE